MRALRSYRDQAPRRVRTLRIARFTSVTTMPGSTFRCGMSGRRPATVLALRFTLRAIFLVPLRTRCAADAALRLVRRTAFFAVFRAVLAPSADFARAAGLRRGADFRLGADFLLGADFALAADLRFGADFALRAEAGRAAARRVDLVGFFFLVTAIALSPLRHKASLLRQCRLNKAETFRRVPGPPPNVPTCNASIAPGRGFRLQR